MFVVNTIVEYLAWPQIFSYWPDPNISLRISIFAWPQIISWLATDGGGRRGALFTWTGLGTRGLIFGKRRGIGCERYSRPWTRGWAPDSVAGSMGCFTMDFDSLD